MRSLHKELNRKARKKRVFFFWYALLIFFILIIVVILSFFIAMNKLTAISPLPLDYSKETKGQVASFLIEQELKKKNINFTAVVKASESAFFIMLPNSTKVVMSKQRNIEAQISSLQFILKRLTIEGKAIKLIDLRFDSPVVVFN